MRKEGSVEEKWSAEEAIQQRRRVQGPSRLQFQCWPSLAAPHLLASSRLPARTCRRAARGRPIVLKGKDAASLLWDLCTAARSDASLPGKYVKMPLLLRLSQFAATGLASQF